MSIRGLKSLVGLNTTNKIKSILGGSKKIKKIQEYTSITGRLVNIDELLNELKSSEAHRKIFGSLHSYNNSASSNSYKSKPKLKAQLDWIWKYRDLDGKRVFICNILFEKRVRIRRIVVLYQLHADNDDNWIFHEVVREYQKPLLPFSHAHKYSLFIFSMLVKRGQFYFPTDNLKIKGALN